MAVKSFPAQTESLEEVLSFVEENLQAFGCGLKIIIALSVAIEEVFVNVANYAYGDKKGVAELSVECYNQKVNMVLSDYGIPFNPLEKKDPDITLSAEERDIGGLGIFITKKTMDSISYKYENGKNILTMVKAI